MNTEWKQKTLRSLEKIFREHFLDDSLILKETTSPGDIEEWDSLAHVNLLATIESCFGVRFTADDMATIDSVGKILVALDQREGKS